jgi:hypothetical protein
MTFGAVLAAILAVVAAAEEVAEEASAAGDAAGVEDGADPAEATAPPETPPEALAAAPQGAALADSAPILIERIELPNGWAVERLVEPDGAIVEHELNRAGTVQSCQAVGSLFTLRVIEQRAARGGEVVEVVRDRSGALLSFAVGPDGEPRAVALLAPPLR